MLPYYFVFVFGIIYLQYAKGEKRTDSTLLAVFMTSLALFVGLGDMIGGYDRYIYGELFDGLADNLWDGKLFDSILFQLYPREIGYNSWNVFVAIFTSNRYIFIFLTTLLIDFLMFRAIKTYTVNYPLATIVFLGIFYYFTMTYLRQAIAVGVVWNAVHYIWERKFWPYLLMVVFAATFHNSALIALLAYIVGYQYIPQKQVTMILLVSFVLAFSPFATMLLALSGDVLDNVQRGEAYAGDFLGFRFDYVLEVIVFMYIYKRNEKLIPRDKVTMTYVNISYIFCAILLIFMRFGQGGRIGWFFMIGFIYCLSLFATMKRRIGDMKLFVVLISMLLFLRITNDWSSILTPYKTFLTNGEPSGKIVYDLFEYDKRYTDDKFYR